MWSTGSWGLGWSRAAATVAGVTAATGEAFCLLAWDLKEENRLWKGERGDRGDLEWPGETPGDVVVVDIVVVVVVVSAVGRSSPSSRPSGPSLHRAESDLRASGCGAALRPILEPRLLTSQACFASSSATEAVWAQVYFVLRTTHEVPYAVGVDVGVGLGVCGRGRSGAGGTGRLWNCGFRAAQNRQNATRTKEGKAG